MIELTKQQQSALEAIVHSDDSFFLTGKPGTGKSVLIRSIIDMSTKDYVLSAPTGMAALNINGKTLHSIFRIPSSEGIIEKHYNIYPEASSPSYSFIRYKVARLIIDEVSMLRVDILEYIDRCLRHIKQVDEPFGGVQLICVGDFYQLPPVVVGAYEKARIKDVWSSPFAFSSDLWDNLKVIELTKVLRQDDKEFIDLLDSARTGVLNSKQYQLLKKRVKKLDEDDLSITICPTNGQATEINSAKLSALLEEEKVYRAKILGDWIAFPCEEVLKLKVGAHVVVKKNNADKNNDSDNEASGKIVNGTLGVVFELSDKYVKIKLKDESVHTIYSQTFTRSIKEEIDGKYSERVIASFEQIPLSLAWAISIHKSQGQTYERVHINPDRMFAEGQLYVALSRAKTLEGITLESLILPKHLRTNVKVKSYYNNL